MDSAQPTLRATDGTPTLEAVGVSKSFGPVRALSNIFAQFLPGEIHAVLGENGAGKSTLMNALYGSMAIDKGEIRFRSGFSFESVGMVHQHFMLVPEFSVLENLLLASRSKSTILRPAIEARHALELGKSLGWNLDPNAKTGTLPVGVQQRIEILKALATDAEILIFDEPTAVLSPDEVEELFRVLRQLRDAGKTIILIAHKLDEVLSVADRVTVLRKGEFVATAPISEVDAKSLAEWMVGELPEAAGDLMAPRDQVALRVEKLLVMGDRGETAISIDHFEVKSGEIFGIGGVDGNGQVELAEALVSIRKSTGRIDLAEDADRQRVAYIPQDRHRDGLALSMSIFDNFAIGAERRNEFRKGPLLDLRGLRAWADSLVVRFSIKLGGLDDPIRTLSGGNQQKVIVARSLDVEPSLVVAVNPVRGLDIRATDDVHRKLREMAERGVPVVLISTDHDELAALAHRTRYLLRGKLSEHDGAQAMVGGGA